jgi:hypothetical protein
MGDDILDKGIRSAASSKVRNYHQRTACNWLVLDYPQENRASGIEYETSEDVLCLFGRTWLILGVEMKIQLLKSLQIGGDRISNCKFAHAEIVPHVR